MALINLASYDNMSAEAFGVLMEELMRKQQIEQKYDSRIKQLNKDNSDPNADRRWYIYIDGKKVKKQTREELIDWLYEREKTSRNDATIASLYVDWLAYRRITVADGTYKTDIRYWRDFISDCYIVDKPIVELDIDDAVAFYKHVIGKKPDIKQKYFLNVFGCVSKILQYAISKKIISDNPFRNFCVNQDLFTNKTATPTEEKLFQNDEKVLIKEYLFKRAKETKEAKWLIPIVLFNVGVRDGELLALRWCDIDMKTNKVHVQSELIEACDDNGKHVGYQWVEHCKSKTGDRELPINSEVRKVLALVKKYNFQQGYKGTEADFIFQRRYRGIVTFCTPRTVYTVLEKACKALDIPVRSPHDIRRTFATDLSYAGAPTKEISAYMGHATLGQTDAYIIGKNFDKSTVQRLESIV